MKRTLDVLGEGFLLFALVCCLPFYLLGVALGAFMQVCIELYEKFQMTPEQEARRELDESYLKTKKSMNEAAGKSYRNMVL